MRGPGCRRCPWHMTYIADMFLTRTRLALRSTADFWDRKPPSYPPSMIFGATTLRDVYGLG